MNTRRYKLLSDFQKVYEFLQQQYDMHHLNSYFLPQFFEYAQTHPLFSHYQAHRMQIIEQDDRIVGFVGYEMKPGEAYLVHDKDHSSLLPMMLKLAEEEISIVKDGQRVLYVWVVDHEKEKIELLNESGYALIDDEDITIFDYEQPFVESILPEGFSAISLEEENDLIKINECLWKGFDHEGEPDDDLDGRWIMQSGPHFDKHLTTIIKAPNGDYACYAGMWVDTHNHYAYLEPLATMPAYRKLGLATCALSEGIKKTKAYGATYCFGGSVGYYEKIGFKTIAKRQVYKKVF